MGVIFAKVAQFALQWAGQVFLVYALARRDLESSWPHQQQGLKLVFHCNYHYAISRRDGQFATDAAELSHFFEQNPRLDISTYDSSTGVATLDWGETLGSDEEALRSVALEKREAFQNAHVTVQGFWPYADGFIPNGTFRGMTPSGKEISGRWRVKDEEDQNKGDEELVDALEEYFDGGNKFVRR